MSEAMVYTCKNGHVLGVITKNGRGLKKLLVYRHAVDYADMSNEEPVEVMMICDGPTYDIVCSKCGDTQDWIPGKAEWAAILNRFFRHRDERLPVTEDIIRALQDEIMEKII